MQPNVDVVNIVQINELAPATGVDLSWLFAIGNPAAPGSKKYSINQVAAIIAEMIGTVTVPDPLYYKPAAGATQQADPLLNGADYYLFQVGIGFLKKGDDWQNDVAGGGWRLLSKTVTDGEIYMAVYKPQVSNILASPDAVARFVSGIVELTTSTVIGASNYRKLIVLKGSEFTTLPLASAYPKGVALFIASDDGPRKQSTVQTQGSDVIKANSANINKVYLGQREFVVFITDNVNWYIQSCSPAIFDQPSLRQAWFFDTLSLNQLPATGGLYNRADYPRAWANLLRLQTAQPGVLLNEASWALNKTFFGSGNGTTTFRVPDMRGYFTRGMDLGANVDADRNASGIGSKSATAQGQSFQAHTHILTMQDSTDNLSGTGYVATTGTAAGPGYSLNHTLNSTVGGTETRPINVAVYYLINV